MSSAADEPTSEMPAEPSPAGDPRAASAGPDSWTDVSADDRDDGWGERMEPSDALTDDWYLTERPPHHG